MIPIWAGRPSVVFRQWPRVAGVLSDEEAMALVEKAGVRPEERLWSAGAGDLAGVAEIPA